MGCVIAKGTRVGRIGEWLLAASVAASLGAYSTAYADGEGEPEPDYDSIAEMDLSELLSAPTEVASARATSLRESPGVLTVVTREEIVGRGARDLIDVLQLVPGFFVGVDVQGTLGTGIRGLWGHEGKILYLLDGHPINEMSYATTPLGGRIPVELIERVEIIRGPGSARYGGYAELAVVNIVLLDAPEEGTTAYASGNYGQLEDAPGRQNLSLAFARKSTAFEGLTVTGRAYLSNVRPSTEIYRDLFGAQYDMAGGNRWGQRLVTLGVSYQDLSIKYLFENYGVRQRDGYDAIPSQAYTANFISHHLSAELPIEPTTDLTITPRLEYHHQLPYNTSLYLEKPRTLYGPGELAELDLFDYDRVAQRTVAGVRAEYDVIEELTLSMGGQLQYDRAEDRSYNPEFSDLTNDSLYSPDDLTATFQNWIAFAEATTENSFLHATLGARFEHHSRFGSSFAPRLALGKVFGDFHVKALSSQAFRSPSFENINLGVDIKPERTRAFELEAGYQLTKELWLTVNGFDLTVERPIIYFFDPETNAEGYANRGKTGSRGVESELRFQNSRVSATVSYAFYTAKHKNNVDDYAVPQNRRLLLSAPAHKLALNGNVRIWNDLHGNANAFFLTKRYAQVQVAADGSPVIDELAPAFVLNLFVEQRNLFARGMSLGVGAYNVTGQAFTYPQPYKGLHASLPGLAREFLVRLSYDLPS